MSIHILTQDSTSSEQLSTLLTELGQNVTLHTELEPLEKAVKKLNKNDAVFYDLSLEDILWAFERLYTGCRRTNLVGFEPLTQATAEGGQHCIDGMGHYLLLPQNADRAKTRLQEVLKLIAQSGAKKKTPRKKAAKKRSSAKSTPASPAANATQVAAQSQTLADSIQLNSARYLHAQSPAMQALMANLHTAATKSPTAVMIEGEDGAEFELAARELNFQANGDRSPLLALDPMRLSCEQLFELQQEAAAIQEVHYCYVGLSIEINRESADQLIDYFDKIEQIENPYLRIIIGHAFDSDSYLCETIKPLMRKLRKHSTELQLPPLSERAEDVPMIAQRIFSTLRSAHPFLRVRTISVSAMQHLKAECVNMDYAMLTRVMRNAMALGQRDILSDKELKNLSDNSPTSQHLIESLADEKYFNAETSGVA